MRGHRRHAHQCCISLLSTKISTSPATALFALCTPFPSISVPPNPPLIVTFPLVRNPFVLPPLFHVYILRMRSQLSHKRQYLSMGKNISCTFLSNRRCPMQSLNPQTWRKTHGNIRGVFKSAGNICTAAAFPSLLTHFQSLQCLLPFPFTRPVSEPHWDNIRSSKIILCSQPAAHSKQLPAAVP